MPRDAREIWSPAKRSIIREWRDWTKKHPEIATSDRALGEFYSYLEKKGTELLAFSDENKLEAVKTWLAEEGLIS